jgi:mRNA-degrading endonuclease toxin of MazEF toxin-antitoxin module
MFEKKRRKTRVTEEEIDRLLRHGSIVYAEFYNSFENKEAGPHNAIVLDSNEQIAKSDRYRVVVISTEDVIDPRFLLPVPPSTGLHGNIVGSWTARLDAAGIEEIRGRLTVPQMINVLNLVRLADATGPIRRKPSTHS